MVWASNGVLLCYSVLACLGRTTMKRFACGDVVPGCDATFVCDTEDDILVQVAEHAAAVHGMSEVPASVVDRVRERTYAVA